MKALFFIFIICFSSICWSQNDLTMYEQNILDKALAEISVLQYDDFVEQGLLNPNPEVSKFAKGLHQRLLVSISETYDKLIDTLPNTKLRNRFDYIIAELNDKQNEMELAKKFYNKVLSNPESLLFWSENAENFERRSINIRLAEIAISENKYTEALFFLDASKKYDIKYNCANAIQTNYERVQSLYRICENASYSKSSPGISEPSLNAKNSNNLIKEK